MPQTIVILTEDALNAADVDHITSLHAGEDVDYRVLVPADTERNVITSIVDHLGLGELREAWEELVGREPTPEEATATAAEQLAESLALLRDAGVAASGTVTDDDPLPALRTAVAESGGPDGDEGVREVVVVTYPHAVEDTFHADWASRAREELHVPVLHLYSGTSRLG
ncbi:hypothetical protein [Isoptericola variabilis]|uniref:Uncharacterized protein n=1 Tax=Isoptericola variabilis (strain 225) TaxID=743718 RepID=F6FW29_ISOV2|nr:hypothetical protein [Isoptericola variabilis]AEG44499.1 hypothetical protein Isova_1752 [Isoptericola variabilis 225]TWH26585.1 hypothetical protein L600_000600000650 [Isoptericola variabilis J7]